jgi:hypothetical protein
MAFGLSVVLIVVDWTLPHPPIWFSLTPVAPLIAYHLAYLFPRARTLRGAEIDSVYYFGFLVTVATLAETAAVIAGAPELGIQSVLYKFGAGLLATGYAVVARLHLQSLTSAETPTSPEQVLEQYLGRSGVLLDNLELAILRVGSLADTAMTETRRVIDKSSSELEEAVVGVAHTFEKQLGVTLETVAESVVGIRNLINDSSFVAEQKAFARTIRSSATVSEKLKVSLDTLSGSVAAGADTFGRVYGAMQSLGETAHMLNSELAILASEHGPLEKMAASIQAASDGSQRAASHALEAASGIVQLSGQVTASQHSFVVFGQSLNAAGDQLVGLAKACNGLDASVAQFAEAMKASREFAETLTSIGQGLPELVPKVHTLGQQFDNLRITLGTTATSLEGDVHRSTQAVELLANNLAAVAQTIVDRTRERQLRV